MSACLETRSISNLLSGIQSTRMFFLFFLLFWEGGRGGMRNFYGFDLYFRRLPEQTILLFSKKISKFFGFFQPGFDRWVGPANYRRKDYKKHQILGFKGLYDLVNVLIGFKLGSGKESAINPSSYGSN